MKRVIVKTHSRKWPTRKAGRVEESIKEPVRKFSFKDAIEKELKSL